MSNSTSFWLLILFSMYLQCAWGQIVFQDRGAQCPKETREIFYKKALEVRKNYLDRNIYIKRFDILEVGEQVYLLPDGMFDVYEWVDGNWINRYEGVFGGYNYGSKKFVWKNRILSFGGYGFWHLHGQLIEFKFDEGGWEILPFTTELPYGIGIPLGDSLRVLCNEPYIIDLANEKILFEESNQAYDLWDWSLNIKTQAMSSHAYQFSDHTIIRQPELPWVFRVVRHWDGQHFERSSPIHSFHIDGFDTHKIRSSFYYLYKDSLQVTLMDSVYLRADALEELEKFAPIESDNQNSNLPLVALSLVLLLPAGWFFYKKTQKQPESQETDSTDPFLHKLLELEADTLDIPGMDHLLEIDHIKSDSTLRYRRSKAIQKINEAHISCKGHPLVHRIRNPEDRRSYVYEIRK